LHLDEIPSDGRTLSFDQGHLEMKQCLFDVIGDNEFEIKLSIHPSGGVFMLSGSIKAKMDLACYRCAIDFKHSLVETINEILVIETDRPRASHSARVNHISDLQLGAPAVSSVNSNLFHVGNFIHELVALAEPLQPKAKEDCSEECENLLQAYKMAKEARRERVRWSCRAQPLY
ncbi:MAG: DUF177 domain-containing protein, partial [Bdellovibrionales bacterium]|nr:DUF177 domain-containing protein [Bdellovibrionales bacterium]